MDHRKSKEIPKRNISFCFIDYTKAFDYVNHNKLENALRNGNTRSHYLSFWETCIRVKKQQLEPDIGEQTGSKLGKEYVKAVCVTLLF